jgi:chemotaxis signal transduction protein
MLPNVDSFSPVSSPLAADAPSGPVEAPVSRDERLEAPPQPEARTREGVYACVFWLDGQRYALDTVDVVEAVTLQQLVAVPLSPAWLVGLTSLRGAPLPVVDLRVVLGLPGGSDTADEQRSGQPLVVLQVEGALMGGRVDRIEAVYAFDNARLEPKASSAEHPAVRGLLEVGKDKTVPATLLDHDELARRVNELRFRGRWEQGFEGERGHVAKA